MIYQITITAKNPKAVKFLLLFYLQNKSINLITTFYKKKRQKKIITVLKSPHVNKKAQTQFEYRIFSIKLTLETKNIHPHIILLKKIKSKLFPEIEIKTKITITKQNDFISQKQVLHPKNFIINQLYFKTSTQNSKQIVSYLKLFDYFGEFNLTHNLTKKFK